MKYTRLGAAGAEVSRICVGGNSWGAKGSRSWRAFDEGESRALIRHALDSGINFFDTADVYNDGRSETILGRVLIDYAPRKDFVLSTKVGFTPAGQAKGGGLSRKNIIANIDASLARLGVDHIDIYLVHRYDALTPVEETVDALGALIGAGKVGALGASSMLPSQLLSLQACLKKQGLAGFVIMQNLYNLLCREEEPVMIPLCRAEGIALAPYSPLARGMLSGNRDRAAGGPTDRARHDRAADGYRRDCDFTVVERVVEIARAHEATPSQVALAWLLHQGGVAAPVIGATDRRHIDEAVAAPDLVLSPSECAYLESAYHPRAARLEAEFPAPAEPT